MIRGRHIAGLVPAAGRSSRFGRDKRELVLSDRTMLEHVVQNLHGAQCSPVVVVVEPACTYSRLAALEDLGTVIIELETETTSMLASIRAGLKALPGEVLGAAVLPGDCPLVSSQTISEVLRAFKTVGPPLMVPRYMGIQGHPRLVRADLFSVLQTMEGNRFSDIFEQFGNFSVSLDLCDDAIIVDCDTPEDVARINRVFYQRLREHD